MYTYSHQMGRTIGIVLLFIFASAILSAQSVKHSINTNWFFYRGDTTAASDKIKWELVSLPHSYNTHDVLDDDPGYYRGGTWYKKKLIIPTSWNNREVYIYFEAVNQKATVFVNGHLVGEHNGGYTAFRFRLNPFLNKASEVQHLAVKVTNAFDADTPPLTADFTFFGGIYRDVYLESRSAVHFNIDQYAADGVRITTPEVSEVSASISVNSEIINRSSSEKNVIVACKVFDPTGIQVANAQVKLKIKSSGKSSVDIKKMEVTKPNLWSPENPSLYRVVVSVLDAQTKAKLDDVSLPLGFRWFSFSKNGFFLNGKPYKIWGTSRHQDYPWMANALPDAMHVKDVQLLKEMGGNFLRVAHYPQDPAILETCDRIGILASVEIPVVNTITESQAFTDNCMHMTREMIYQNYNHPSVIMWAPMNEILLRMPFNDDKPRQEIYLKNVAKLSKTLDSLIRKEDATRYTMMAFHGYYDLYKRAGLINIPMVAGWNLYQGWYGDKIEGFGTFLDNHFKEFPETPILVTEYGADGDPRLRSFSPVRFDKSLEYETYYHQVYIDAMMRRPFVSGGLIWNLADFNSETRAEAMPHVNNKGIVDGLRVPKDSYYLYQAFLSKKPYIKIASRNWKVRSGIAVSEDTLICIQKVDVYTNSAQAVKLMCNGKLIGTKNPVSMVASFEVPFEDGMNLVEAALDETTKDVAEIDFMLIPSSFKSNKLRFHKLNVSLGDNRYFTDEKLHQVWLPEQEYKSGGWGYIGGSVFRMKDHSRISYGSDKNILGTDYDPIYETQRVGIEGFRLDVPDGQYEITFHFAELLGGEPREALAYNLAGTQGKPDEKLVKKNFDITINGSLVLEDIGKYLEPEKAFTTKVKVDSGNGDGINIQFQVKHGEAILNGLQVKRIF